MSLLKRLTESGFVFKKSLGQNFIVDEGYLTSIVKNLCITKDDTIVEVGTGAGTLTRVLARFAARVITYEIDERLKPILTEQFAGHNNITLKFQDALKDGVEIAESFQSHLKRERDFRVVANIPYYITTPLVMKFLNDPNCTSICVLVQREVAERIVAKPGSKHYGALSVGIQARATARIIQNVPRHVFVPMPQVMSAFVQIENINHNVNPEFDTFLKSVFSQRRKKLSNIIANLYKEQIANDRRPEQLSVSELVELWQKLFDKKVFQT